MPVYTVTATTKTRALSIYSSPAMSAFYRWRFFIPFFLVFLTGRFIKKVAGDNADDNCRKEFKDAAMKNKIFIAVVMEEEVKDQRAWPSITSLDLGSRLIDASGDLTNPEYMNHVVDQIRKTASLLDVGAIPASTSGATHPTTVFNCSASTRLLERNIK
jgi:hypothetical protein